MPYVNVPNDLSKIKTKIAFNLTRRQLICFGGAAAVGIPVYLLTRHALGGTGAMFLMIALMLPAFFMAMYERDGLPFEKVARNIIRAKFLRPGVRPYQTQRLRELGESCPQKQEAVFFRQRFHRQGAQLVNAHGGIVMFRRPCPFALISPRRVGVKDVVGFLLCFLDSWYSSCLSMCGKYGFRYAAGLEQTEAKQNGIAHTAPDRTGYVVGGSDLLDQHRINPDNHHD